MNKVQIWNLRRVKDLRHQLSLQRHFCSLATITLAFAAPSIMMTAALANQRREVAQVMNRELSLRSAAASRPSNRWYALGLLTSLYAINSIDRQVFGVILEPMKRSLRLTDTAAGLLAGPMFAVSFAATSLPLGWLIDRFDRRVILASVLSLWSILTLACGLARTYAALALARIGVGAFESGGSPACQSLISDYFVTKDRSLALGVFYFSSAIGVCVTFLIGSVVAARFGWRAAFLVAGAPGLALSLLIVLTLKEPPRGFQDRETQTTASGSRLGSFFHLMATTPALFHLTLAATLTSMVTVSLWTWATSFLVRTHGLTLVHSGQIIALAAVFSGVASPLGGKLAQIVAGDRPSRMAITPAASSLALVPFGLLYVLSPTIAPTIVGLAGTAFMTGIWLGPTFAQSMILAPPQMRGIVAAGIQLTIALLSVGLGPLVTGVLSDHFGIATALAVIFTLNIWAAIHFLLAARPLATSAATMRQGMEFESSREP